MSYKKLKIWEMAQALAVDIHQMTLTKLPKFEMCEGGSQIRRAINGFINGVERKHESVRDQISYYEIDA